MEETPNDIASDKSPNYWWCAEPYRSFFDTFIYKHLNIDFVYPAPGMSFREGTLKDYDRIVEITDVTGYAISGGWDYIPGQYHYYIRDPDHYVFVAEIEGKVIALFVSHVIENGTAMYEGGGRRDPAYKGMQCFVALRTYGILETLRLRPTVRQIRGVSPHLQHYLKYSSEELARSVGHVIFNTIEIANTISLPELKALDINKLAAPSSQEDLSLDKVRLANLEDLQTIMREEKLRKIFPGGWINQGREPFSAELSSNAPLFTQEDSRAVVNEDLSSLSTFFHERGPRGVLINWRSYGATSPRALLLHLLRYVPEILRSHQDGQVIILLVYYPTEVLTVDTVGKVMGCLPFFSAEKAKAGRLMLACADIENSPFASK